MSDNIFKEKEDYLLAAKEAVANRDSISAELDKLNVYNKKLSKNISAEEKSISDEISSTIKKRKQEIADTYDDRIDDNRARKKRVVNKRDKKKTQRVNERIADETKEIRDNTRDLEVEMKTLLKKNHVPGLCNKKIFYLMFMPKGFGEVGGMLISFLIYFLGIPAVGMIACRMTFLDGVKNINFVSMALWFVFVIIQIVIYFMVYTGVKVKHSDVLAESRAIMDKIKANKRQADAIQNSITKDKDESAYNLEAFDEKIANLESEAEEISEQKKKALKTFEDETQQIIIDEINGRRLEGLDKMKSEKKSVEEKISELEKKYSEVVLDITKQYASYIGEELCKEDKLSDLIALMEDGQAETVSEAVSIYKGQKSSK